MRCSAGALGEREIAPGEARHRRRRAGEQRERQPHLDRRADEQAAPSLEQSRSWRRDSTRASGPTPARRPAVTALPRPRADELDAVTTRASLNASPMKASVRPQRSPVPGLATTGGSVCQPLAVLASPAGHRAGAHSQHHTVRACKRSDYWRHPPIWQTTRLPLSPRIARKSRQFDPSRREWRRARIPGFTGSIVELDHLFVGVVVRASVLRRPSG